MIKTLWFVMTLYGQVSMTAGPLPFGMADCLKIGQETYQVVVVSVNAGKIHHAPNGQVVTVDSVRAGCYMLESKPKMGSDFGG